MIKFEDYKHYDICVNDSLVLEKVHFDKHEGKRAVIEYLYHKKLIKSNDPRKYKVSVGIYTIFVETPKGETQ